MKKLKRKGLLHFPRVERRLTNWARAKGRDESFTVQLFKAGLYFAGVAVFIAVAQAAGSLAANGAGVVAGVAVVAFLYRSFLKDNA